MLTYFYIHTVAVKINLLHLHELQGTKIAVFWLTTSFFAHVFVCVLQALGDSNFPAVLRQLLPLMKPCGGEDSSATGSRKKEDECGPDELILLLIYLYSLADEAQPADQDTEEEELEKLEKELIGALTLVITQETELSPLLQKLTGERKLTQSWHHDCFQEHAQFARFANVLKGKN